MSRATKILGEARYALNPKTGLYFDGHGFKAKSIQDAKELRMDDTQARLEKSFGFPIKVVWISQRERFAKGRRAAVQ